MVAEEQLLAHVEFLFLFSLVWSVGATTDFDGRTQFSQFLKEELSKHKNIRQFPEKGLVYDYYVEPIKANQSSINDWKLWSLHGICTR